MTPIEATKLIELYSERYMIDSLPLKQKAEYNAALQKIVFELMLRQLLVEAYKKLGLAVPRSLV